GRARGRGRGGGRGRGRGRARGRGPGRGGGRREQFDQGTLRILLDVHEHAPSQGGREGRMAVHDRVLPEEQHLARGGGLHGGGSNWAIHEGSGSSSTGREARRAWTSRAPTRRHAARSAAIAPCSAARAASIPPPWCARTIGSAKPARSAPRASA